MPALPPPDPPKDPDIFVELAEAKRSFRYYLFVAAALALGSMMAATVAATAIVGSVWDFWRPLGMAFLVGAGAFMVAGLLGLIFGIPRFVAAPEGRAYLANTNLEQISDWLTKILVGFGLAQASAAIAGLRDVGQLLGPGFTGRADGGDLIVWGLIVVNLPCGFYFFYVWARLYLPILLYLSEHVAERRSRKVSNSAQDD